MPQHRHTFHEKLVEIGGEDREKLCFFEQRRTLVESLGKNALIEVQPTEIAIDPDIRQILRQGSVQHPVITDRCKSRHAHEMSSRGLLSPWAKTAILLALLGIFSRGSQPENRAERTAGAGCRSRSRASLGCLAPIPRCRGNGRTARPGLPPWCRERAGKLLSTQGCGRPSDGSRKLLPTLRCLQNRCREQR